VEIGEVWIETQGWNPQIPAQCGHLSISSRTRIAGATQPSVNVDG
jgi:hypothetical protein